MRLAYPAYHREWARHSLLPDLPATALSTRLERIRSNSLQWSRPVPYGVALGLALALGLAVTEGVGLASGLGVKKVCAV